MDGVMYESIAHARFMDVPRFRIGDVERLIAAVPIGMIYKIVV